MIDSLVKVKLIDEDNILHAEGYLEYDKIASMSLIIREGKIYQFKYSNMALEATFVMQPNPYQLTEF